MTRGLGGVVRFDGEVGASAPPLNHTVTQLQSPIHITSVSDFDDDDYGLGIVDRVENSVVPSTEMELLLSILSPKSAAWASFRERLTSAGTTSA